MRNLWIVKGIGSAYIQIVNIGFSNKKEPKLH